MNIWGWFLLGLTGLTSLLSKEVSRAFSSTTVRKHHSLALSVLYGPTLNIYTWTTGKTTALIIRTFVSKVMSLLCNLLHTRSGNLQGCPWSVSLFHQAGSAVSSAGMLRGWPCPGCCEHQVASWPLSSPPGHPTCSGSSGSSLPLMWGAPHPASGPHPLQRPGKWHFISAPALGLSVNWPDLCSQQGPRIRELKV